MNLRFPLHVIVTFGVVFHVMLCVHTFLYVHVYSMLVTCTIYNYCYYENYSN